MTIDTTVVIPVYYNEATIVRVVEEIRSAWIEARRKIESLEFVLVDDGSRDDSWLRLVELHDRYGDAVIALRLVGNHGSQLAILAGASHARGERIAMVAADGQEPPDLIPRMAAAADSGSQLVLGTRTARADSASTRAGAGAFYQLLRLLGFGAMPKEGFDTFLMTRDIMESILRMRDPNIPLAVTIAWLGYPYAAVPYERLTRIAGKSRWTLRKKLKLALDAITAVSYAPIRLISLFGTVVALAGFGYAAFVIATWLMHGIPVQGWTSLLVSVLVIGGTQLIALGVIGEYLWRTLEIARRRPLWRIAEKRALVESNTETQFKAFPASKVTSRKPE